MKTNNCVSSSIRWIAFALAAPLAVSSLFAQVQTGGVTHVEKIRHAAPPLQDVTFLGVVTHSAMPAVTAQVDVPAETGLVVVEVQPDSPAAGVVKVNDLLIRLDDQILIEPRQLGVLVRSHKEGDEVKLTFFRGGRQQTAQVKLGKRAMPQAAERVRVFRNEVFGATDDGLPATLPAPNAGRAFVYGEHPKEMRISRFSSKDSVMFFDDGSGRLELNFKDGKKQLTAFDPKGAVIFSGPVDTPEERKAMPAEVRARLEKMESTDVRLPALPHAPAGAQFVSPDGASLDSPASFDILLDDAGVS